MSETKTEKEVKADKTKELEKELQEKIAAGALKKKKIGGKKGLYSEFRAKVGKDEPMPEFLADAEKFQAKVDELLWDKKTFASLKDIVGRGLPLEKFCKYYPHIPLAVAESKVKADKLTGVSHTKQAATFLGGFGRVAGVSEIKDDDIVEFENTSRERPYETNVKGDSWGIAVLNGANIGVKHQRLILENPLRCGLSEAQRRGDKAAVLVNFIDIDTKKAGGPPKVSRALMSGLKTKLDVLEPKYAEKVRKMLRKMRSEVVYETTTETFLNILMGLRKVAHKPNGNPEFAGPVLILLGPKEEAFIRSMAYWELRYKTLQKISELDGEIRVAKREEAPYGDLVEERARTIISFIRSEDWEKAYKKARTFFVRKTEEVIPGSKVVGHKTTFLKFGEAVVEFFVPDDDKPADSILADFADEYASQVLQKEFPEAVVICHPHSLNFRMTAREVDADGKRGSGQIFVAPTLVDDEFLRQAIEQLPVSHRLAEAVFSPQFQAGLLRLECIHGKVINPAEHSVKSLIVNAQKSAALKKTGTDKLPDFWRQKHIWLMGSSDPHWGGPSKVFVRDGSGQDFGICEAVIEMMRRKGLCDRKKMPVHLFLMNDDPTQGHHIENEKRQHPHKMPFAEVEKRLLEELRAAESGSAENRMGVFRKACAFASYQLRVRGEIWPMEQIKQLVYRHLKPNADFFSAVLGRGVDSGLLVKGVSRFQEDIPYDSRDIGAVNFGTGNHFRKTVNAELVEGSLYAIILQLILQGRPEWSGQEELLETLIKAPFDGEQALGWGTVAAPGGYEWGLEFRSSPAVLSSWGDTLLGQVRNDQRRGNYSRIFEGRVTLKTSGDKHFVGVVRTSTAIYHMVPPGTATDSYGDKLGFPPNNTGVSFVGLPADGPDSGPSLIRTLRFDQIRDYFAKPYDFDWEEFLPNPV